MALCEKFAVLLKVVRTLGILGVGLADDGELVLDGLPWSQGEPQADGLTAAPADISGGGGGQNASGGAEIAPDLDAQGARRSGGPAPSGT